jgi:hypothetical protein
VVLRLKPQDHNGYYGKARASTLRRQIINVPARLDHRSHGIVVHLPTHWPAGRATHM